MVISPMRTAISACCLSDNMLLLSNLDACRPQVRVANIAMTCTSRYIAHQEISIARHCIFHCYVSYDTHKILRHSPKFSNIANIAMTCISRYIAHHRISNHFSTLSKAPQVLEVFSLDQKIFFILYNHFPL